MPIVTLVSNVKASQLPDDFQRAFVKLLASTLKKPEEGVALHVIPESRCYLGIADPDAPLAILNVKAIGHLSAEENEAHTTVITDFVESQLGIKPARVLIHFENLEKREVAKGGVTIERLLEGQKK